MTDLIYPTLDLFLYDLRNGLGDSESEISDRRQHFQKKLPETVHKTLFKVDTDFETEYRELLPKAKIKKFATSRESDPLTGYYYPVRLGDTYGLLVDCSVENQTDPQPAECVAELKQEIEQNQLKGEKANIGQTWMISGWMPPSTEKTPEEVAIASYKSLITEGNWSEDLEGQGKFMGADIFELSRYRLVIKEKNSGEVKIQNIQNSLHVIIIIYPNKTIAKKAANFYFEWMQLFVYRHKIFWCYGQSRILKQSIKNYFSTIEDQQNLIKKGLNTGRELEGLADLLRDVQILLNNYTIDLNKLEFQSSTIDINLSNYQKRWIRIAEKARIAELPELANAENDLSFLEQFSKSVTDKYQFQIHKDSENLERGQKLLENIINAARSRVEVEKADRDQKFQDLITILGVGWAAGSFVKDYKSETDITELTWTNFPLLVANYITPLMYPLSVAILVAFLTGWVKTLCDRSDFLARVFGLLIGKVGKK